MLSRRSILKKTAGAIGTGTLVLGAIDKSEAAPSDYNGEIEVSGNGDYRVFVITPAKSVSTIEQSSNHNQSGEYVKHVRRNYGSSVYSSGGDVDVWELGGSVAGGIDKFYYDGDCVGGKAWGNVAIDAGGNLGGTINQDMKVTGSNGGGEYYIDKQSVSSGYNLEGNDAVHSSSVSGTVINSSDYYRGHGPITYINFTGVDGAVEIRHP